MTITRQTPTANAAVATSGLDSNTDRLTEARPQLLSAVNIVNDYSDTGVRSGVKGQLIGTKDEISGLKILAELKKNGAL